jgi:hypothetical protein
MSMFLCVSTVFMWDGGTGVLGLVRPSTGSSLTDIMHATAKIESCLLSPIVDARIELALITGMATDRLCNCAS